MEKLQMTFMKADYSKNEETSFEPLPKGEYEMIIQSAGETATKNGAESLEIKLVVRNDLDNTNELQKKYHNRIVFNNNWKRKATNQYDMQGFQYILDAVKIPEGTDIPDVQAFCDAIAGKPVLVYVDQRENEYQGKTTTQNQVAPWGYKATKFPEVQHVWKKDSNTSDPFEKNSTPVDIKDSDLPF